MYQTKFKVKRVATEKSVRNNVLVDKTRSAVLQGRVAYEFLLYVLVFQGTFDFVSTFPIGKLYPELLRG